MNGGTSPATPRRSLSGVLAIVAAVGWGAFAWSWTAGDPEVPSAQAKLERVQNALDRVTAERDQLAVKHNQLLTQVRDLQEAERRVVRAQEEVANLERMRVRLTEAVDRARAQLGGGQPLVAASPPPAQPQVPAMRLSEQQIRAAQEALIGLGYGPLQADGMIGPGTRTAIKTFERSGGLAITGELTAATVEALEAAAGVSLQ
ncbi:peptidoglycan-binding domain-containing protein [Microvirga vignae]|uniref:peptidoglycan-binding domain-containing protein n=1 Tax=Microvirga vignae TaxID=1225564 RepID=UPI00069961ED|nr:peptidoglycan-binding domain-containing protein [Microvirga vignae]